MSITPIMQMPRICLKLTKYRYWLLAFVPLLIVAVIFLVPTESAVRLVGLFFQLLGIMTVIWGISDTWGYFGHPSFTHRLKKFVRRISPRRGNTQIQPESIQVGETIKGARIYSVFHAKPNATTTEERLANIEYGIDAIQKRIANTEKQMDQAYNEIYGLLKFEHRQREQSDNLVRKELEGASTGSVHISLIGAFWLSIGVFLSTASKEISCWLI